MRRLYFHLCRVMLTTLLTASSIAEARDIAPYFYTWAYNQSVYSPKTLMQAKQDANVKSMTLAFAITDGSCRFNNAISNMIPDIRNYVAAGGRVIISLGGASGTYIETACTTDDSLYTALDNLIISTGVTNLDFDVEGDQLYLSAPQARRTRVLKRLQTKYPQMYLSYTLPVDAYSGLGSNSRNIISQSIAAGVNINIVNLMTMDYYYQVSGKTMGDLAIMSAEKVYAQLRALYTTAQKSNAQIYNMIGITPMIGTNDDTFVFKVSDAQKITDYAISKNIGFISYWALQRDRVGTTPYYNYSQQNQYNYQYYKTFEKFLTTATLPPTPAPQIQVKEATFNVATVTSGQSVAIKARINSSTSIQNSIIQLSLANSAGVIVDSQDFMGQNLTAGLDKTVTWNYSIPDELPVGKYTFNVAVFSADWSKNYLWSTGWGSLQVNAVVTTPTILNIYSDALSASFTNASWTATVNFAQTDASRAGKMIGVQQGMWGGLSLLSGSWSAVKNLKASDYTEVRFLVYSKVSLKLAVSLVDSTGKILPAKQVSIAANTWTQVKVPMTGLNPQGLNFNRVTISEVSGKSTVTYFVDELLLSK